MAVKRTILSTDQERREDALREKNLLRQLAHKNIARYIDHIIDDNSNMMYLVLEPCVRMPTVVGRPAESTTLKWWVQHRSPSRVARRTAAAKRHIALGLVSGVDYLHNDETVRSCIAEAGILHRDLKPENVLLLMPPAGAQAAFPTVKLADLGLGKALDETVTESCVSGTLGWQAPEVARNQPNTRASDVFSLGLVLYYVLTDGEHALGGTSQLLLHLLTLFPTGAGAAALVANIDRLPTDEARDMLRSILKHDAAKRAPVATIKRHPFFLSEEERYGMLCRLGHRLRKYSVASHEERRLRIALQSTRGAADTVLQKFAPKDAAAGELDEGDALWAALVREGSKRARREYDTSSVIQLLRFIRNTSGTLGGGHYDELPPWLKAKIEAPHIGGIEHFVLTRFPSLVMGAWLFEEV